MGFSKRRITFFGHFGSTNFGNEATLQATLFNLRRLAPDADFSCICTNPEIAIANYDIVAMPSRPSFFRPWAAHKPLANWVRKLIIGIPSEVYRWLKAFKTLRTTDALIVPGTGLLTDAHSFFYWGPYDMFRWSVAAKISGCKILFVSVGAGPIYTRAGRFFIRTALSLADFRSYRDESSKRYLKGIGFRAAANDLVFPDLAFSLCETALPRGRDNKGRGPVVGIGLMEHAGRYGSEKRLGAAHRAYLETLAQFIKWLVANDYQIRFVIGDLADAAVTREFKLLLKEQSATFGGGRVIDEPVATFGDVLRQIAATDFVVATRFHNVLFSLLLHKPTIAISFHHKCSSLMSQMGMAEYCEDINQLNVESLLERFGGLQHNAGRITEMLTEKTESCKKTLDEQYDIVIRKISLGRQHVASPAVEIPHRSHRGALS